MVVTLERCGPNDLLTSAAVAAWLVRLEDLANARKPQADKERGKHESCVETGVPL